MLTVRLVRGIVGSVLLSGTLIAGVVQATPGPAQVVDELPTTAVKLVNQSGVHLRLAEFGPFAYVDVIERPPAAISVGSEGTWQTTTRVADQPDGGHMRYELSDGGISTINYQHDQGGVILSVTTEEGNAAPPTARST